VGDQLSRERGDASVADSTPAVQSTDASQDQVSETGQVDGEGAVDVTTGHDGKTYPRKPTSNKSRELTPTQTLVKRAKAIAADMAKVEHKVAGLYVDAIDDGEPGIFGTLTGILGPPYERLGVEMNRLRATA
jgi:hypothetical protein